MSFVSAAPLFTARNSRSSSYQIEQSLRFNDDDSAYLQLNGGTSATDGKIFTHSVWVKRSEISGNDNNVFGSAPASTLYNDIKFDSNDRLFYRQYHSSGGAALWTLTTTARYRDPSAWLHIVIAVDTTQSTSSDRVKMYVNGAQITEWDSESYPGQNQVPLGASGSYAIGIGRLTTSYTHYFDGYMAEYHYVDGTAHEPTDFGEYDDSGVWRPIEVTGITYGDRGFYMKFDSSAANGIGHDHSGNSNHFTANSFNTSGGLTDVMSDTPTKNWCTANPLAETGSNITIEDANLVVKATSSGDGAVDATIAVPPSGKFYIEATLIQVTGGINQFRMGLQPTNDQAYARPGDNTDSFGFRWNDSAGSYAAYDEGTSTTYGTGAAAHGDIVGMAIDRDNGEIKVHINNTYFNSGSAVITGIPTVGDYLFRISLDGGAAKQVGATLNFGQREFAYPPGTSSATSYFNTVLYTGNGDSTRSVTGVGFEPDFVWIKDRDASTDHLLYDVNRGASKILKTVGSGAGEETDADSLTSFDSDGFSLGSSSSNAVNVDTRDYVAWCWKAGGAAQNNTDGSQTAAVSANDAAGFSVMKWDYSGSASYTVGHGLSTAPKVLILKKTEATTNWFVRHGTVHTGNGALFLNSSGNGDSSSTAFSGTAPTDSVITVNGALSDLQGAHVCYAFAEKSGVSSFGSYTGNGSEDGPQIYTGFKPALVIIKRSDSTGNWFMFDTARGQDVELYPDSSSSEATYDTILLTNTGFKLRSSTTDRNTSGGTYIYMAFAENFSADADHKELNTSNLPAPGIKDGSEYLSTNIYSGTGSAKTITTDFQSDFIWIKRRNGTLNHAWVDSLRGLDKILRSNTTSSPRGQITDGEVVTSITSTGFVLGTSSLSNNSSGTYVAWAWPKSSVGGFDVLTYTGTGANRTVSHSLGVKPAFIAIKEYASNGSWVCYHKELGATKAISLESNGASYTSSTNFNDTEPTSSVFTVGTANDTNADGNGFIAYLWSEVENYSKFGKYTGNGDNNGPFVYTGFRPAFVLTKRTNSTSNWIMLDNKRDINNPAENWLRPNSDGIEENTGPELDIDFLANGFKIRNNGTDGNISGSTYVFMAFAEYPFGGSGVSPVTAR